MDPKADGRSRRDAKRHYKEIRDAKRHYKRIRLSFLKAASVAEARKWLCVMIGLCDTLAGGNAERARLQAWLDKLDKVRFLYPPWHHGQARCGARSGARSGAQSEARSAWRDFVDDDGGY